jgi:hypothetical protein
VNLRAMPHGEKPFAQHNSYKAPPVSEALIRSPHLSIKDCSH